MRDIAFVTESNQVHYFEYNTLRYKPWDRITEEGLSSLEIKPIDAELPVNIIVDEGKVFIFDGEGEPDRVVEICEAKLEKIRNDDWGHYLGMPNVKYK